MAEQNRPKTELPAGSTGMPAHEAAGAAGTKRAPARQERTISKADIEKLAYRYWEEGGRVEGTQEDNWKRAEADLRSGRVKL